MYQVPYLFLFLYVAIEYATDPFVAFKDADVVFFLASLPMKGNRASLLSSNISIYMNFGKALEAGAHKNCKSIVVANPANTLTYVLMKTAPSIARDGFIALNRTDFNRARMIALRICREKCNYFLYTHFIIDDPSLELHDLHDIFVWGNHSDSMFADVSHAMIRDKPLLECIPDLSVWDDAFVKEVQKRGWVLMQLRDNVSSSLSVARASVDVARDIFLGTNV